MPGALEGVRVLDLSQLIAAPYATQLLADMGADVIKVEEPALAPSRRVGLSPQVRDPEGNWTTFAAYWINANRNKRAITLQLKSPEGKRVFADLVRHSHVVVENFTERMRNNLGIDERWALDVNPAIVWASLTGFGRTGPDSGRGSFDPLAQARGGYLSITGDPVHGPIKSGNSFADFNGGLHLAVAILGALRHAERTGGGQLVDVSMLDCVPPVLDGFPTWVSIAGVLPTRTGNVHPLRFPGYGVYGCQDGFIAIGASLGPISDRLREAIGRTDLVQPPLADKEASTRDFDTLNPAVEEFCRARTRAEVRDQLDRFRVPNEPVRDLAEIWDDPQLRAREMFVEWDYAPLARRINTIASPLKLSRTPVEYRTGYPGPGEHNWDVLQGVLGYGDDEIARLAGEGVTESYE